jgi:dihydrofolate reductase
MSMSLDGFITGPGDDHDRGLGLLVRGADLAQSCLLAGVLDELAISLVPVLLGEGRRLFDHLGADHIELEPTRVLEAPGVMHLHYRVAS